MLIPLVGVYLVIMSFLAYYGYRKTHSEADFLVAGRNINPGVMALSYGATFISTSALIGFGGTAAQFGFSLLWLAFLNIVLGIFVAFAVFGPRIRKMSKELNVFTFPSFLGRRYDSTFITVFSGIMIFIFMPAYTSIVLISGGRFLQETLSMNFDIALLLIALIVGIYVFAGGLKGVMYTDAFGGLIMFVMMAFLLFFTYQSVGGIVSGHEALSALKNLVPDALAEQGHQGWTAMPELGSPIWWTVVSTLVLGVGIGVLAQPQLAMRFMTVKDNRALNRAILVGGLFIFFMTGAAFIIGPLSNLYFQENMGQLALAASGGNVDLIIPTLISEMMPDWFVYLFTLTAMSAVISTVSSLIHVQSAAFGEDILKRFGITELFGGRLSLSRIGVIIGMIAAVILAYLLPGGIVAQATSFWFGICAIGFLPTLVGAMYWKGSTKAGATASIVTGFAVSIFGFLFLHAKEASAIGLSEVLFGTPTLFEFPMTHINPLIYALPISAIVFIVVSLMTNKNMAKEITEEQTAASK